MAVGLRGYWRPRGRNSWLPSSRGGKTNWWSAIQISSLYFVWPTMFTLFPRISYQQLKTRWVMAYRTSFPWPSQGAAPSRGNACLFAPPPPQLLAHPSNTAKGEVVLPFKQLSQESKFFSYSHLHQMWENETERPQVSRKRISLQ